MDIKNNYLKDNKLVEIVKADGQKPANLAGAIAVGKALGMDKSKIKYDEIIDSFVFDESMSSAETVNVHLKKTEEHNAVDAIKRIEDTGIEMLSKKEAVEMINQMSEMKLAMEKMQRDSMISQFYSEEEKKRAENKFNQAITKEAEIFEKALKDQGTVNMTITRKRNAKGKSMELKSIAYDPHTGAIKLGADGRPIITEYLTVTLNGKKFGPAHLQIGKVDYNIPSFDLGRDEGTQFNVSLMLENVPWSVACLLAEKRYPQPLINHKTGQRFTPRNITTNTPSAPLIDTPQGVAWQHSIAM